jgi:hypothetical protein
MLYRLLTSASGSFNLATWDGTQWISYKWQHKSLTAPPAVTSPHFMWCAPGNRIIAVDPLHLEVNGHAGYGRALYSSLSHSRRPSHEAESVQVFVCLATGP